MSDPAIIKARQLLKDRRIRDAVLVYEARITELTAPPHRTRSRWIVLTTLVIAAVIAGAVYYSRQQSDKTAVNDTETRASLVVWCKLALGASDLACEQWTHDIMTNRNRYHDAKICVDLWSDEYYTEVGADLFASCLIRNDIRLP